MNQRTFKQKNKDKKSLVSVFFIQIYYTFF